MPGKTSKGKQRIEMAKISNESSRQVTFCKRRSGLFKKASDLCTLSGVEIAIIIYSPANKNIYSFGHPSVESLVNRFNGLNVQQTSHATEIVHAQKNVIIGVLNSQVTQVEKRLESEQKKGEELVRKRREAEAMYWYRAPLDDLSPVELAELKQALQHLKQQITQIKSQQATAETDTITPPPPVTQPSHQDLTNSSMDMDMSIFNSLPPLPPTVDFGNMMLHSSSEPGIASTSGVNSLPYHPYN